MNSIAPIWIHILSLLLIDSALFITGSDDTRSYSSQDAIAFVHLHNGNRRLALPTAKSMNFVTWSATLSAMATMRAKACRVNQDIKGYSNYKGPDESYFFGPSASPPKVFGHWLSELQNYRQVSHNSSYCKPGCTCAHYANIMSSELSQIGCGFRDCGNGTFLTVCLYSHYHNAGQEIYQPGPPCSECPKDKPFCFDDLCVSGEFAQSPEATMVYGLDMSRLYCRLACKNCGSLVTSMSVSNLQCECKCLGASGTCHLCSDRKNDTVGLACSPFSPMTTCLNGGVLNLTMNSSCICPFGFSGVQCETDENVQNNSVSICVAKHAIKKVRKYSGPSRLEFFSSIWPILQAKIASYVTADCRFNKSSMAACCSRDVANVTRLAGEINASSVILNERSVERNADGSLHVTFSVIAVGSGMCSSSVSSPAPTNGSNATSAPTHVPLRALLTAVTSHQADLSSIPGVSIRNITKARGPDQDDVFKYAIDEDDSNGTCLKSVKKNGQKLAPSVKLLTTVFTGTYFIFHLLN